jgi:hypothetical protein
VDSLVRGSEWIAYVHLGHEGMLATVTVSSGPCAAQGGAYAGSKVRNTPARYSRNGSYVPSCRATNSSIGTALVQAARERYEAKLECGSV